MYKKYLKSLIHESKRSHQKKKKFVEVITTIFNTKIDDFEFMEWLRQDLGFQDLRDLFHFMEYSESPKHGRPVRSDYSPQNIYDFWLENSVITTDRRNRRHIIKVKDGKIPVCLSNITTNDLNVSKVTNNHGTKLKAQKYIYTMPIRQMYHIYNEQYPDTVISFTQFYRCKPFYVLPPSAKGMESCMCAKCLNPHKMYEVVRGVIKDLPVSLTSDFECPENKEISYPYLNCIHGICINKCGIKDDSNKRYNWNQEVPYYIFKTVTEVFYDKEGVKKTYNRTARVDKKDSLKVVYNLLHSLSRDYLEHRFFVSCDKVYWEKFLNETEHYVVWMDYSQNIAFTPKFEVQSSHFSGKQHTLHCTIIKDPKDGKVSYLYHLSEDTNHDSVMIFSILEDLVENHPEIISTGTLVLRYNYMGLWGSRTWQRFNR